MRQFALLRVEFPAKPWIDRTVGKLLTEDERIEFEAEYRIMAAREPKETQMSLF